MCWVPLGGRILRSPLIDKHLHGVADEERVPHPMRDRNPGQTTEDVNLGSKSLKSSAGSDI